MKTNTKTRKLEYNQAILGTVGLSCKLVNKGLIKLLDILPENKCRELKTTCHENVEAQKYLGSILEHHKAKSKFHQKGF